MRANILQAALPLAVTSFVYAEEYKVHADIMSTGFVPFTAHFLLPC
jgi:auxin efflux carrier family